MVQYENALVTFDWTEIGTYHAIATSKLRLVRPQSVQKSPRTLRTKVVLEL